MPFGDKSNDHAPCDFKIKHEDRHNILEYYSIQIGMRRNWVRNFKTLSHWFVMMKDVPNGSSGTNDALCTCFLMICVSVCINVFFSLSCRKTKDTKNASYC